MQNKTLGLSGYSSILPRTKFGVSRQESSPQRRSPHGAKRNNPQRFYSPNQY